VVIETSLLKEAGCDLPDPVDLLLGHGFGWGAEAQRSARLDFNETDGTFEGCDQVDFAQSSETVLSGKQTPPTPDEFIGYGGLGGIS
jgi:hypothetical protein